MILSAFFAWLSIKYVPSAMLLFWLVCAVGGDLVTGLLKAWAKKKCTVSRGFRKTIVKILSYTGTIVAVMVLVNVVGIVDVNNNYNLTILIDSLMGFMVFIELFSICENISIAYPGAPLTKYLVNPMLKFLKGRIQKNPLTGITQEN